MSELLGGVDEVCGSVVDWGDGSYGVVFVVPEEWEGGEALVSVLLRGRDVAGSPFRVSVAAGFVGTLMRSWGVRGGRGWKV